MANINPDDTMEPIESAQSSEVPQGNQDGQSSKPGETNGTRPTADALWEWLINGDFYIASFGSNKDDYGQHNMSITRDRTKLGYRRITIVIPTDIEESMKATLKGSDLVATDKDAV